MSSSEVSTPKRNIWLREIETSCQFVYTRCILFMAKNTISEFF